MRRKRKLQCILVILLSIMCFLFITSGARTPPLIENIILEKVIEEVSDNLSGLTWDESTNTLMAVTNRPACVIQLDENGRVLKRIVLANLEDTESLTFIGGNQFFVVEERTRAITPLALDLTGGRYTRLAPHFVFDLGGKRNEGIEGIAYSKQHDILFVANEKNPAVVYKIEGFIRGQHSGFKIEKIFSSERDISGLAWDETRQRLYVLSDEAKMVREMDINGVIFRESDLSDIIGHIPQPEGIAVHQDRLYIVSEPNVFYVLKIAG